MSHLHDQHDTQPEMPLPETAGVLQEWADELGYLYGEWRDEHEQTLTLLITELHQQYPDAMTFIDALHRAVMERGMNTTSDNDHPTKDGQGQAPSEAGENGGSKIVKQQRPPAMRPEKVTDALLRAGYSLRQGSGSHIIVSDTNGNMSTVSMNGGRGGEFGPMHLRGICRQLGRTASELFGKQKHQT